MFVSAWKPSTYHPDDPEWRCRYYVGTADVAALVDPTGWPVWLPGDEGKRVADGKGGGAAAMAKCDARLRAMGVRFEDANESADKDLRS
jgi:hypothetical protein